MNGSDITAFHNPALYIPASLSELHDMFYCMIGEAPAFTEDRGVFPDQGIDSRFHQVTAGFDIVRQKLGEEGYAAAIDLAARAKALFAADPDDNNGKTNEGVDLIYEMMAIVQSTRKRGVATKQVDDGGEITSD